MKQTLTLCLFFLTVLNLHAQEETCKVEMDGIKGKYTGACIDGKAHGQGKSKGIDEFEGEFKKGLPDGLGKYTWQNSNYYVGSWKKGRMEGNGEMHIMTANGDSTIKGFWKKDKYIGRYEKQYVVITTTPRVYKIDISLTDKKGEDIYINIHQKLPGVGYISNITNITGSFYSNNTQMMTNSSKTRIQQVIFPYRAIFTFSNGENAEILFNEKGNYDVYIDMQ